MKSQEMDIFMSNINAVKLRPMLEKDLGKVLSWRNKDSVRKNMYTSHVITMEEHRSWWVKQSNLRSTRLLIAALDGLDVGVVTFSDYSGEGGLATWAFYAGDVDLKGIGSMMEAAALEYAFNELKVRKLECEVLDFNMSVVRLHMKHGFRIEGISRSGYQRGENICDIYRLGLLNKDWIRYIKPMILEGKAGRLGVTGKQLTRTVRIDEEMVGFFSRASGDWNPVHHNPNYAKEAGFTGCIAHGMLTGSLFSGMLASDFPGEGTIYLSQSLSFLAPVTVGSEVTVRMRVLSQFGRRLILECECLIDGAVCLQGEAEVLAPESFVRGES